MVFLLLCDNLPQSCDCIVIHSSQRFDLLMHMAKNNSLDGNSGGQDGLTSGHSRECAEHKASEAAPQIAPAAAPTSSMQLGTKESTMTALMCQNAV